MIVSHTHRPPTTTPSPRQGLPGSSAKRADTPGLPPSVTPPSDRVLRARRLLQLGLLDTPERLDAAIDKLFDAEFDG